MGLKIGRILEQAREERELSLLQVEEATKIRARYLKELERENFDVLPAVYVQGSLRTYADYLGLDTEPLVRELKYRQASRDEPHTPAYAAPRKGGAASGSMVPAAGLVGAETHMTPEEKGYVAPALSTTGGNNRLYLASAALLILVLAVVAFASTLAAPGQPRISQVREPLASQVPEGGGGGEAAYLTRSESDGRSAGEESDSPPAKHESSDGDRGEEESGREEQTEEIQDEPGGVQDAYAASTAQPSSVTATATATATAIATAIPTAMPTATAGAAPSTVQPVSTPPPGPTEASPESPRAPPAPPVAEASAPEPAADGPRGGSPVRRIVVAPVRTPSEGPVVVRR